MIETIVKREKLLLQLLFGSALSVALWLTVSNISNPLTGAQSFRQTQTALSAYWIAKGGPWFDYETPVLGAPWSVPFEFPLYQLCVAGFSSFGIPLDVAGRLVSFMFFLACFWPIRMLVQCANLSEETFWRIAILFVSSPLCLFWGGSFMIESCALFFSLVWLAFLTNFLRYPSAVSVAIAAGAGCLAALVKITTFLCSGIVGGLAALVIIGMIWRRGAPVRRIFETVLGCAIAGIVPLVVALKWTSYADQIKILNEFAGAKLVSMKLAPWNFGTLTQRLDVDRWYRALVLRTLPDMFGFIWPVAIVAVVVGVVRKPVLGTALCAGFLSLFLIFTNLAFVHDYYPFASAVFLIAAIAISLDGITNPKTRFYGILLVAVLSANQVLYCYFRYFPEDDFYRWYTSSELGAAEIVKSSTAPGSSVLVFGEDWSSIIQYLSERRGLSVWDNAISDDRFAKILSSPQDFLSGSPLGAIVICRDISSNPVRKAEIEKFVSERTIIGVAGVCRVVSPQKRPVDLKL